MNIKTYRTWQAIIGLVMGGVVGLSVALDNWILAFTAIVAGMIITIIVRRNIQGIIADERNYTVAYKAACFTVFIAIVGMAIAGAVILIVNRNDLSGTPAQTGFILAYIACGLMVVNTLAYTYYNHQLGGKNE